MTIYENKSAKRSRYIDISVEEDGTFRMDLQDLGPSVNCEGEYERSIWNIDLNALCELFQVQERNILFQVIALKYGNENGFDLFKAFMTSNHIKYAYWAG